MFGSKDKPEHPKQDPERDDNGKSGKKGLFGWMRRKAEEPAAPVTPPPSVPEPEAPASPPPVAEVKVEAEPVAEPVNREPTPAAAPTSSSPAAPRSEERRVGKGGRAGWAPCQ